MFEIETNYLKYLYGLQQCMQRNKYSKRIVTLENIGGMICEKS